MVNFHHTFIPHAASLLLPLHCALQKSHSQKVLSWTADMDVTFASCKEALPEATILSHPTRGAHISLTTDASDQAIGGLLEQYVNGIWQPLAFFSKRLRPPEMRYSTFDRELLALYLVCIPSGIARDSCYTNNLNLSPLLTVHHNLSAQSYVPKSLRVSKFVFIRHDGYRGPLQRPYDGPFQVVAPGVKTFRVMVGDREEIISVDRLKLAHVDLISSVPVTQPLRRGRPPLQPAQSDPQETPEPKDTSSRQQARSTRSGRAVRLPPRFQ
ncbi:transposon ty3-g Gag-Pol polyprotein [Plakobranchus ocellatus]|uniref:Transposon ty3-g Gag-Pol polyprotein n=1 Tax=Plakobranchus ocellatus TaxID=259542 RepID=A0AAV4DZ61_9GAST|nr:transposon ty3-g Gag-Pol polyprotein [Plakobranchus ocellatus]